MIRAELQTKYARLGIEGRRALEGAGQPPAEGPREGPQPARAEVSRAAAILGLLSQCVSSLCFAVI